MGYYVVFVRKEISDTRTDICAVAGSSEVAEKIHEITGLVGQVVPLISLDEFLTHVDHWGNE